MKHDHVLLVCPHCPKKFNKTAMHAHIKKVHSGFNMCPVCGAKVIQKQNLFKNGIYTLTVYFR